MFLLLQFERYFDLLLCNNIIMRPKPKTYSIYSRVPHDFVLFDKRSGKYGIVFGTVSDLCRQLGVEYEKLDKCTRFYAPKNRLQLFVEKLHFSKNFYSDEPLD